MAGVHQLPCCTNTSRDAGSELERSLAARAAALSHGLLQPRSGRRAGVSRLWVRIPGGPQPACVKHPSKVQTRSVVSSGSAGAGESGRLRSDKGWMQDLQIPGSSGMRGRLHRCLAVLSVTQLCCRPPLGLGAGFLWAASTIPTLRPQFPCALGAVQRCTKAQQALSGETAHLSGCRGGFSQKPGDLFESSCLLWLVQAGLVAA